jgi:hypothetical protein
MNKVIGPIPESFFLNAGYLQYLMLIPELDGETDSCKEKKEIVIRDEMDDFLGFFGGVCHMETLKRDYSRYYSRIKNEFTVKDIIIKYRNWLSVTSLDTKISDIDYVSPREFGLNFERQFASYYEVFDKIKKYDKDIKVFIPGDGVGAGSIICSILGIDYYSTEHSGLGSVAYGLGIISSNNLQYLPMDNRVSCLFNLSNFFDIRSILSDRYVVFDENRLIKGMPFCDIKFTSNGKVYSNFLEDDFSTMTNEISRASAMLRHKCNVPLNSKAEFYLLKENFPVYNDGVVCTVTPSLYTNSPHYIDTTSKMNKDTVVLEETVLSVGCPTYLNIKCTQTFSMEGKVHGVNLREHITDKLVDAGENLVMANYSDGRKEVLEGGLDTVLEAEDIRFLIMKDLPPKARIDHYFSNIILGKERYTNARSRNLYNKLDIVSRNYPMNLKHAKLGNIKTIKGNDVVCKGQSQIVTTDNSYETINIAPYNSPFELKDYDYVMGNYIGRSINPARVRFLNDNGVIIYLVFLHSFMKNGKRYDVFKDSRVCQMTTKDHIV